jgi:hypothetical protein
MVQMMLFSGAYGAYGGLSLSYYIELYTQQQDRFMVDLIV